MGLVRVALGDTQNAGVVVARVDPRVGRLALVVVARCVALREVVQGAGDAFLVAEPLAQLAAVVRVGACGQVEGVVPMVLQTFAASGLFDVSVGER